MEKQNRKKMVRRKHCNKSILDCKISLIFGDEFEWYDSKRKYGIRKTKSKKDCEKKIFYSLEQNFLRFNGLLYTVCKNDSKIKTLY